MKKHLIILCLIIYVSISCYLLYNISLPLPVSNENNLYGRILTNTLLLKTPTKIEDYSNSYFLLEESYFVNVINTENDNYYYVNYLNLTGYVKKNDIELVSQQISSPYLKDIKFDIVKDCFLYLEPKNNNNSQILPLSPQNSISYYGKIYGDEISQNSGNVWYYCVIANNENSLYGYIHSSYTNNLSPIVHNTEYSSKYINKTQVNSLLNLNLSSQTIIIISISLPVFILLIILLKGFKKV